MVDLRKARAFEYQNYAHYVSNLKAKTSSCGEMPSVNAFEALMSQAAIYVIYWSLHTSAIFPNANFSF